MCQQLPDVARASNTRPVVDGKFALAEPGARRLAATNLALRLSTHHVSMFIGDRPSRRHGLESDMGLRISSKSRTAVMPFAALCVLVCAACSGGSADSQTAVPPGRALVDAIGIENIMTSPMHQQMLVFMRPLQTANKGHEQEVFEIFDNIIMPQATPVFTAEVIKDEIGKYYDQNFSATELQDLIGFFSSPVGRKFAAKSSFMADGLPRLAVRLLGTVTVQGALHLGIEEMQKRGLVLPEPAAPRP